MTDIQILTLVLCVGMSVVLPVSAFIFGSTLSNRRVPEVKETLRADIKTAVVRLESKLDATKTELSNKMDTQHSELMSLLRSHEQVHHTE